MLNLRTVHVFILGCSLNSDYKYINISHENGMKSQNNSASFEIAQHDLIMGGYLLHGWPIS